MIAIELEAILSAIRTGAVSEAEARARSFLDRHPDDMTAWSVLAYCLDCQGRRIEAAQCCRPMIAIDPAGAQAYFNLGLAENSWFRPACAARHLRRAVSIAPDSGEAHIELGNALGLIGGDVQAELELAIGACLRPDYGPAYCSLGSKLALAGSFPAAMALQQRALAVDPMHPEAHFARATLLLAQGQFADGWVEYEWRRQRRDLRAYYPQFAKPEWRRSMAESKRVLIHAEQGLGDTIQFCRFIPLIAAMGVRPIVQAPDALIPLLHSLAGEPVLVRDFAEAGPFDAYVPICSLPYVFDTRVHSIPASIPYLSVPSDLAAKWRDWLGPPSGKKRIGVVWQGNPESPTNVGRSVPLRELEPLSRIEGTELVVLQRHHGLDQIKTVPFASKLRQPPPIAEDSGAAFLDSAALIAGLDFIVTVDTSIAHLAGALGRRGCVLLNHVSEWRWLISRTDSPWYPTLTLFRQPQPGDWQGAVAALADALRRSIE